MLVVQKKSFTRNETKKDPLDCVRKKGLTTSKDENGFTLISGREKTLTKGEEIIKYHSIVVRTQATNSLKWRTNLLTGLKRFEKI